MRFRRRARPTIKQAFEEAVSDFAEAQKSGSAHDQACASDHVMELAGVMAAIDKSPSWLLVVEAHECKERGDWPGVEAALLKKLDFETGSSGMPAMEHFDLASLYAKLCSDDDVRRHVALGAQAARQATSSVARAMLYGSAAGFYISFGDVEQALPLIGEGLTLLDTETMFDTLVARLTIMRAACASLQMRLEDAEADLANAKHTIDATPMLPGHGGNKQKLSEWWDGVSAIRQRRGDVTGAVEAFEKSLEIIRQSATIPHCAGVDTEWQIAIRLRKLAKLLENAGESQRAAEASAEAKSILQAIGLWEYQKEKY